MHGGFLFVALMSSLYDGLSAKLDYIDSRMDYIEEEMFDEREREMVFEISKVSQTLITFRQILFSHKEVLESATPMFLRIFNTDFEKHIEKLVVYYQYLARRTSTLSASLQELRDTNDSLLSTKQNEIMKALTVMAFVTYPLALIAAVFGMNTEHTPFVDGQYGFLIILGIMVSAALTFFAYFKYKRWL
jgi:magnesium transporter